MVGDIWRFYDDYRAHVTAEQYRVMMKWTGVQHGSIYTYPDKPQEYDIQFPKRLLPRVKRYLSE